MRSCYCWFRCERVCSLMDGIKPDHKLLLKAYTVPFKILYNFVFLYSFILYCKIHELM